MPIEHINKTDTLNEGREKLNNAITAFNETVVEGDSSVEAAQARVDEKGVSHPTLKARIDDGMNSVNQQLAEKAPQTDIVRIDSSLKEKVSQVQFDSSSTELRFYGDESLIDSINIAQAGNEEVVKSYVDTLITNGLIEGATLSPGTVSPRELNFVNESTNLFNVNTVIKNRFIDHNNGGAVEFSEINQVSDWISVTPGEKYTFRGFGKIAYYSRNKEYDFQFSTTTNNTETITIPVDCFYIRLQSPMQNTFNEQLNKGEELLPYEPYYATLDSKKLTLEAKSVNFTERTPIGHTGYLQTLTPPNIDESARTLSLGNVWVLVGNERYGIAGPITLDMLPNNSYQILILNTTTNELRIQGLTSGNPLNINDDDIVVIHFTIRTQGQSFEVIDVTASTEVYVNGVPFNKGSGGGIVQKPYQFVPEVPSYDYVAETLHATDFDHETSVSADVYNKFDELATSHSGYVDMTLLGNDETGTLPIYKLEFNPETAIPSSNRKPLPTIIINCAMHGDGSGGLGDGSPGDPPTHAFSLYYFFKEICENWQSSKALEYLRWNVRFVVIPISNPWGFDNKSRYTSEGIDINRDFGAFETIESRYIRDVYLDNKDAIASIDYHMIGGLEFIRDDALMRYFINADDPSIYQISEQTLRELSRRWNGKYNLSDIPFYGIGGATSGHDRTLRGWGSYDLGVPTITIEGFLATDSHREKSGSVAITMNVEHLGNWIMNAVRYFYNE